MNKLLMQAQAKFRGQKAKVESSGFDNSNLPPGKYVCVIKESAIRDMSDKDGSAHPKHYIRVQVSLGASKGRSGFPFKNKLDDVDGISAFVKNVRAVLGDVVPGKQLPSGEFEYDYGAVVGKAEEFAAKMIGEVVEVTVVDNKKGKLKEDGTCWQSWYLNRGLGADAAGATEDASEDADDQLPGLGKPEKKPVFKKK